jgi:hypothetical protein
VGEAPLTHARQAALVMACNAAVAFAAVLATIGAVSAQGYGHSLPCIDECAADLVLARRVRFC